jgi:hypothetical protein
MQLADPIEGLSVRPAPARLDLSVLGHADPTKPSGLPERPARLLPIVLEHPEPRHRKSTESISPA